MTAMKLLGVDYGTKKTGLATADTAVPLAFPLRTIEAVTPQDAAKAVAEAAAAEGADRIVVGVPYRLSGEDEPGESQRAVAAVLAALRPLTAVTVETEDERLSTAAAARLLREAGGPKRRGADDALAAAAILETYIARLGRSAA